jgi:hypothetical protein
MHYVAATTEYVRFARGTTYWRYTTAEADLQADIDGTGAQTWRAGVISRSGFVSGPEQGKRAIEIQAPPSLDLVAQFRGAPDPQPIGCSIWRAIEDVDFLPAGASLVWTGRLLQTQIADGVAQLRLEPATVSLKRLGLRRLYSRACTHMLYGAECQATPITAPRAIAAINGAILTMDGGITAGLFAGGYLERADGSRHMIVGNDTIAVSILYPYAFELGEAITLVAGCDHALETCEERFANTANYGGFPWIPTRNPFQATAY